MNDRIRSKIQQVKQFAQKHPTLVACTATGLISWKLSHDITIKTVIKDTAGMMYVAGHEVGVLGLERDLVVAFVHEKGLVDELNGFALRVIEEAPQGS